MTTMTINFEQTGKTATNVWDIFLGGITSTQALTFIGDAWVDNVMPQLTTSMIFTDVTIGGDIPVSQTYNSPGGNNQPSNTINTCYLIDKNPDAGRRGRLFLPGVAEPDVDQAGTVTANRVTALNSAFTTFLADVNGNGVELRIARADGSFNTIESFTTQSTAATQRRRMRR